MIGPRVYSPRYPASFGGASRRFCSGSRAAFGEAAYDSGLPIVFGEPSERAGGLMSAATEAIGLNHLPLVPLRV